MSTNFYAYFPGEQQIRHLGQRAGGWQFLFRAYPDLGIVDIKSWLNQLARADWIHDEYDKMYDQEEFLQAIEACRENTQRDLYGQDWKDHEGNTFSEAEFS